MCVLLRKEVSLRVKLTDHLPLGQILGMRFPVERLFDGMFQSHGRLRGKLHWDMKDFAAMKSDEEIGQCGSDQVSTLKFGSSLRHLRTGTRVLRFPLLTHDTNLDVDISDQKGIKIWPCRKTKHQHQLCILVCCALRLRPVKIRS